MLMWACECIWQYEDAFFMYLFIHHTCWLDILLDGDSVTTEMVVHYLLGKSAHVLTLFVS